MIVLCRRFRLSMGLGYRKCQCATATIAPARVVLCVLLFKVVVASFIGAAMGSWVPPSAGSEALAFAR